jgi:hypothetical protein
MELQLKRLALFSSGVGFFEHSGIVGGPETVNLVFDAQALNDALKSLAVNDPASEFPSVSYASASALKETLRSLKVDLSGKADIWSILNSLKGAEVDISAPAKLSGSIVGVEKRSVSVTDRGKSVKELYLLLFTGAELKSVAVKDISSFSFKDETITGDLRRALAILSAARDDKNRRLAVSLPGEGERNVSLSYVVPVPVWKASYRLDLGAEKPFIQGWAIVDNDSDTDWNDVELSLVTGRPVSFIQNLSEPYLTNRPELPLAIAGFAKARTYESGEAKDEIGTADSDEEPKACFPRRRSVVRENSITTAEAKQLGEQFAFTLRDSVTIERRQSAMLPLIEAEMQAKKLLVLDGEDARRGTVNPSISVELVNTTGMKLPAGPITVYDGGSYAGDALIEFLPENEKRIISYGEDLSVRGSAVLSSETPLTAVMFSKSSKNVLSYTWTDRRKFVYTVRNASSSPRKLIIEHSPYKDARLVEPSHYEEKTPDLYRFAAELPANKEIKFTVIEEKPFPAENSIGRIKLGTLEMMLESSMDKSVSDDIRSVVKKAFELKKKVNDAEKPVRKLEEKRDEIIGKQKRIRKNLEAAGNQSAEGQRYLSRLAAMEDEIDALTKSMDEAEEKAGALKKEFEEVFGVPFVDDQPEAL